MIKIIELIFGWCNILLLKIGVNPTIASYISVILNSVLLCALSYFIYIVFRLVLVTAIILGVARVVGETAPLLLTIGGADAINLNPGEGNMSAFPYYVWKNLLIGNENSISRAWTGVFVLMILVLIIFTLARYFSSARGNKK